MTEKTLSIIEKTTPKGTFKNVDAYSLNNGEEFTCKKVEATSRKIDMPPKGDKDGYSFWAVKVEYKGETVGFIIKKPEQAQAFDSCGGVGDSIKVSLTKEIYTDKKGVDRVKKTLVFAKV